MTATFTIDHHDTVAVLTLRNEAGMNSFDPAYLAACRKAMTELLANNSVRAIVLTGSGRAFSTGANVADMQKAAAAGTASQWVLDATAELHPLLQAMVNSEKPIISAINGVAAGGGLGLALASDARIGCAASRFAAGYFGIGLSPDGGATWLLPRLIGLQRTRQFFFNNEVMDAETAFEWGLLDAHVEANDLLRYAINLARQWGAWGAASRHATKALLTSSYSNTFTEQMNEERRLIAGAAGTDDFRAGTTAFVSKQTPDFN